MGFQNCGGIGNFQLTLFCPQEINTEREKTHLEKINAFIQQLQCVVKYLDIRTRKEMF